MDPAANAPYRPHNASRYKGKHCEYSGPLPALLFYLPWRVITGFAIATNPGVVVFGLVGYLFSCLLLFKLVAAPGIQSLPA